MHFYTYAFFSLYIFIFMHFFRSTFLDLCSFFIIHFYTFYYKIALYIFKNNILLLPFLDQVSKIYLQNFNNFRFTFTFTLKISSKFTFALKYDQEGLQDSVNTLFRVTHNYEKRFSAFKSPRNRSIYEI